MKILLCGDVMTGRGIDQILPHRGSPVLYEPYIKDARDYILLAEDLNGPIARPVDFTYIWGDALEEFHGINTDVRIINLETSITSSDDAWPDKGIHYRMHPHNINCLTEARIDCCCLANNHVLDWGYGGLDETLQTLDAAGIARSGAGRNRAEAAAPAVIDVSTKGRVLVFSFGTETSGIPSEWAATSDKPGVSSLNDLTDETARGIVQQIRASSQPDDVKVVSIHWGGNWGYHIPAEQTRFAHQLVDGGVDIVHGHSSHHVKGIEIYRDRPIFYGCGDFLDDYEGISGYEAYRDDLRAIYEIQIDPHRRRSTGMKIVPMQVRRFRLQRASEADSIWLRDLLNQLGASFGTRAVLEDGLGITLQGQ